MTFPEYVLRHLPPPPVRVLEVGCGEVGGATPAMFEAGYDVLAIDPRAPIGPAYRQIVLEQLDDPGPFAAVVAGRVLHHVQPLAPALDRLAALAPLLIVDEFALNHIDAATQAWYEGRYREIVAAGGEPKAPASIDEWRAGHADLHPYERLRAELDARYEEREVEWRPYFYHWLGAEHEADERDAIAAGAIRPIGVRYVGGRRKAKRTSQAEA
ncbi:MAG: hypothetical protein U0R50_14395 [Gaiellales bacterium]